MEKKRDYPILSFVIATKNCANDLVVTLKSFLEFNAENYEIFIQDGMSEDSTAIEARNYTDLLPIFLCQERDKNIYDAWNKAIRKVRGEWILFMGAGDTLYQHDSIEELIQILTNLPRNIQYYSSPIVHIFPSGEKIEILKPDNSPLEGLRSGMCLPHQGLCHRRDLFFDRAFDADFRIAGDYDFVCRTITKYNYSIGKTPHVCMAFGGISSSMDNMVSREKEFFRIARDSYPTSIPWKILERLTWWYVVSYAKNLGGDAFGRAVAEIPRRIMGKPSLWTRSGAARSASLISGSCIDLLVATIGRVEELDRLLTSLEAQTYKKFRILLADQNPPGFLDDMLARHQGLSIERIVLPSQGVSIARNVLLEHAAGDIIVFPDDDCWYAPDTLERVCEAFAEYPTCGALLGVWTSSPKEIAHGMPEGIVSRAGLFNLAGTCVQFYRKEAVTGIRFDPLLGPGTGLPYGCGEDTDYLLIVSAHAEVRRYAKIRVFHPSPKENQPSPQKVASYAAGRMYLLKKHKFSKLFVLFNVLYPLCLAPVEFVRYGKKQGAYRLRMFFERLRHWNC